MNKNTKLVSLSFLACAVVAWLFFRQLADALWDVFKLNAPVDWVVAPSDIIGIVVGIVVFIVMNRVSVIRNFTDEVIGELAKVTWPEKKETVLSTGIIVIMVAIASLILLGFDVIWGTAVKIIF
ncbi:preprotein translocase subunit SecE [bacterium]|nr:preprotein translocase subunit SecE [bacterium]